jgi:hypothetical protein
LAERFSTLVSGAGAAEEFVFQGIWSDFHSIVDHEDRMATSSHRAISMVGRYLENEQLRAKYFKKYLTKQQSTIVLTAAKGVFDESQQKLRQHRAANAPPVASDEDKGSIT